MRIHHLNCGSLRPYFPRIESLVYCLLVETSDGLLLVDTGFGTRDCLNPTPLMKAFASLLRCPLELSETAVHQVAQLGYDPEQVRHIVMTHLHIDHSGGLPDFPQARVHVHAREYEAIRNPRGFIESLYVQAHWDHGPQWAIHCGEASEPWFGFESLRILPGLQPEIRYLPLPGHSRGHCAVAIKTNRGWLLHCGDSTYPFYHTGQELMRPPAWLVRWLLGPHTPRLRALQDQHGDQITLITSHDLPSFEKYQDRSDGAGIPDPEAVV
jgi:glyoxylase-like metal-dependent hydrolase (beta-lactamase superfamily II)